MKKQKNFTPIYSAMYQSKHRYKHSWLALLLAGCILIAGCSKQEQPLQVEVVTEQSQDIALAEAPVDGGALKVPIPLKIDSLDPFMPQTKQMRDLLLLVYEPLMRYDKQQQLSPVLAESWEAVDEQGLMWRIRLRNNAKWHDKKSFFTAQDVVFTYNLLKTDYYADSIYRPLVDRIANITIEDEQTILIEGVEAGYMNIHAFTFPIVSSEYFQLASEPVGTGPYLLDAASQTQGVYLSSNHEWWHRAPYISQVVGIPTGEGELALGALELNNINFLMTEVLTSGRYREQGQTGMLEVESQQSEMLLFNHRNSMLNELSTRLAIAYALDQRDILSKVYLNHAVATDVPIPPDSWLYDASLKKFDQNIALAKETLAEAGWQDLDNDGILDRRSGDRVISLQFELLVNDTPESQLRKDVATLIKEQLQEVGISVTIVSSPWSSSSNEYGKRLQEGSFDLALAGFNVDQSNDLRPYLAINGSRNYGAYSDEEMTALLNQITTTTNDKDLKTRFATLQSEIIEKLPFIEIAFRTSSIGYSEKIQFADSMWGRTNFAYNGIERWYFNDEGRVDYPVVSVTFETDWRNFDASVNATAEADSSDEITDSDGQMAVTASSSTETKPKTPSARAFSSAATESTSSDIADENINSEDTELTNQND